MNRKFRLSSATDIRRVRRTGKSYAHPLVFLITSPNGGEPTRLAVTAGQSFGNAVQRNRAKRRMREALGPHLERLRPGWDLLLIARPGLRKAPWPELLEAVAGLLRRAQLVNGGQHDTDE